MIIGLSGKKQSGKDTIAKDFQQKMGENVRLIAFADKLKEICIEIFGLTYKQCYGSDEDKNTLTKYNLYSIPTYCIEDLRGKFSNFNNYWNTDFPKDKVLTAREFMQMLGTEVFRKIFSNVWVSYLFRQIDKEGNLQSCSFNPEICRLSNWVITDCRFPNELDEVKSRGGITVKLTRGASEDGHASETAADNYKYDYVIDNRNMTKAEQLEELVKIYHSHNMIKVIEW